MQVMMERDREHPLSGWIELVPMENLAVPARQAHWYLGWGTALVDGSRCAWMRDP